jgi:hypothetical protein
MSAVFELDTKSLLDALTALGHQVDGQVSQLVETHAREFAAEMPSKYPSVTGNLRGHVTLTQVAPHDVRVRLTARHAHLYEFGTIRRFTAESGAHRGEMPAKPTFVPAVINARLRMMLAAVALLRSLKPKGFSGALDVRKS